MFVRIIVQCVKYCVINETFRSAFIGEGSRL